MEGKWWVRKSSKNSKTTWERQEKTDFMCLGGMGMGKIVAQLGRALSASADTDIRITSSITSQRGKSIAAHLNAHARCLTMFQSVIIIILTFFSWFSWLPGFEVSVQTLLQRPSPRDKKMPKCEMQNRLPKVYQQTWMCLPLNLRWSCHCIWEQRGKRGWR